MTRVLGNYRWLLRLQCDLSGAAGRLSVGVERPCSELLRGQLWFNPLKKGLYVCDGSVWITVLEGEHPTASNKQFYLFVTIDKIILPSNTDHKRLDYVLEQQVLTTSSETHDVEVFLHHSFSDTTLLFCFELIFIWSLGVSDTRHWPHGCYGPQILSLWFCCVSLDQLGFPALPEHQHSRRSVLEAFPSRKEGVMEIPSFFLSTPFEN